VSNNHAQIPNFLDMGNHYSSMASLSHTVIFHVEAAGLSMVDEVGEPKWFCLEETIDHISHGRGLATCKLWDVKEKRPLGSTMQDGMIRMPPGIDQNLNGMFTVSRKPKGKL
jgi:acyl-CoA thioesterase